MEMTRLSCPYCNSTVAVAGRVLRGQRLQCPRCQETFAFQSADSPSGSGDGSPAGEQSLPSAKAEGFSTSSSARSNRLVSRVVLGIMTAMACFALIFALSTTESRRRRDQLGSDGDSVPPLADVPPAGLAALGYLPPDTDLVAGLHVAALLQTPSGKQLLEHSLAARGGPRVPNVEELSGVRLENVDHCVLGLRVQERFYPSVMFVVQTRGAYDPEAVRDSLHAGKRTERGKKTIYRFKPRGQDLEGTLWCASDRTLVVSYMPEDLDAVPASGKDGVTHLTEPLQNVMRQHLPAGTLGWLAGHGHDWAKTVPLLAMIPGAAESSFVDKVQTFAVGLQFDDQISWSAALGCTSQASAQTLDKLIEQAVQDGFRLPALANRPGGPELAHEFIHSMTREQSENWLALRGRMSVETVHQVLFSSPLGQ